MTVAELINELSKFPDNFYVCYPSEDNEIGCASVLNVSRGINEFDCVVFLDDYVEED
jgi:hypothetical protein